MCVRWALSPANLGPATRMPKTTGSTGPREDTRLIRAGQSATPDAKTVGPSVQKGSTVLLPDAASLYDDGGRLTYGRQGLSAQFALR